MSLAWTVFLPRDTMPSNSPNLTLDEQSFQGLLSAAFTIQEHNDRLQQARQTPDEPEAHVEPEANSEPEANPVCPQCGAPKPADAPSCQSCGPDELRPGERLQRNWASMWLMSQEQGLWPERSPALREVSSREGAQEDAPPLEAKRQPRAQTAHDFVASNCLALPVARKEAAGETISQEETAAIHLRTAGGSIPGKPVPRKSAAESKWTASAPENEMIEHFPTEDSEEAFAPENSGLAIPRFQLSATGDSFPIDSAVDETADGVADATSGPNTEVRAATSSMPQLFQDWRVHLRFNRADLYLGTAIFVAALALLWPVANSPRRAALGPWERALVTLGIAEAPAPAVHLQGDPGIQVWVDPHTALYYCPGEEQYGKTADGRVSSQREAQMDRFEPASRSACE
jgi:ribosomal protein L40E